MSLDVFPALRIGAAALVLSFSSSLATADELSRGDEGIGYYIGVDTRPTLPTGTYAGLANPNLNRLTYLLDHGDHYHTFGSYTLTGPASSPTVVDTNANNRIPEPFSRVSPETQALNLIWNPGLGLWWSNGDLGSEYDVLGVASVQTLDGRGGMAQTLFNSSGNRWSASFEGVTVGLRLLSSTSGLTIGSLNPDGTLSDANVFDTGNTFTLGGSNDLEFRPVFWVNGGGAPGTYTAEFQLVNLSRNLNPNVLDGGRFYVDVAVPVPEPETYALFLAGLVGIGLVVRRRSAVTA
jgi:hypothetical protein